jgi:hypothetical protein
MVVPLGIQMDVLFHVNLHPYIHVELLTLACISSKTTLNNHVTFTF